MSTNSNVAATSSSSIPADDPRRNLVHARSDDRDLPHIGLVGDTYTVLLAGRFCLIDMHVTPGGGPPPHRHDFEETFVVLDGGNELTFRGVSSVAGTGETVLVPANAPHQFTNKSGRPARLLCICSPAGQEEFFAQVGVPVATRTTAPPKLDAAAEAEFRAKVAALAAKYKTELLQRLDTHRANGHNSIRALRRLA
jgi:mannose-6-phosphate isomerase-like protein (cupin superfamily)